MGEHHLYTSDDGEAIRRELSDLWHVLARIAEALERANELTVERSEPGRPARDKEET